MLQHLAEFDLYIEDVVDSTNDYLWNKAKTCKIPTVVIARQQLQGRGTKGRRWDSAHHALYMSILITSKKTLLELQNLSTHVAYIIANKLIEITKLDIGIKLPNDLYIAAKKLGGILIETKANPQAGIDIIIGCGINIEAPLIESVLNSASLVEFDVNVDATELGKELAHTIIVALKSYIYKSKG